jgi:hypothetical protein
VEPRKSATDGYLSYSGGAARTDRAVDDPGSLVTSRITPLRLEAFEQLPKHARRCVFWEVDPSTVAGSDHLADPEFEKEAWLSMVMLEWGSCGQIAQPCDADGFVDADADDPCLGYAFYAPPRAVPRAQRFPTGPVSADAVLLTSIGVESSECADGLPRNLIAAVVSDLVRRGVRALEAFGRTAEITELNEQHAVTPELAAAVSAFGECAVEQCVIDADFLHDNGFVVVAPDRYFPRLRLELEQGLGWKADVEAALERLLETTQLAQPVGALASPMLWTPNAGKS